MTSASLTPQSPPRSIFGHRPAPALRLVEAHQAVDHGLARQDLQLRIKRRTDRQSAFIQFLFAVAFIKLAPHFLGEIFAGKGMRARRLARDAERRALCLLRIGGFHKAGIRHSVENPIAPLDRALALTERMIISRRLGQRREIGRLGNRQLVHRLVEVDERSSRDAISTKAEINLVQVKLENFVLAVGALDLERQQRLLELTLQQIARWSAGSSWQPAA